MTTTPALTVRQLRSLDLTSQGFSATEIARTLGTTTGSITACMHRAYQKLGANSAAHAVRIALETGLIPAPEIGALRAELTRVYAALVVANDLLASRPTEDVPPSHPFGDYLLRMVA